MAKKAKPLPTLEKLAEHLHKSPRQVSYYMGKGLREVCKVAGGYDGDAASSWLAAHLAAKQVSPMKERLDKAKLANLLEDRKAKELKRRATERELVSRQDVIVECIERLAMARTILETLPDSVVKELPSSDRSAVHKLVDNCVRRCLIALSQIKFIPSLKEPT